MNLGLELKFLVPFSDGEVAWILPLYINCCKWISRGWWCERREIIQYQSPIISVNHELLMPRSPFVFC